MYSKGYRGFESLFLRQFPRVESCKIPSVDAPAPKIVLLTTDAAARQSLVDLLRETGCEVVAVEDTEQARQAAAGLIVVHGPPELLPALPGQRVIALVEDAAARIAALDLGASDALAAPWDPRELQARLRVQLRALHSERESLDRVRLAEEGFQLSQTAFEALAVTERMKSDALRLNRILKFGAYSVIAAAAVMAVVFAFYSRGARRETQRAYGVVAQLERGLKQQSDLMERTRKMREEFERDKEHRQQVEEQSRRLREKMDQAASAGEMATLRQELTATSDHLKRMDVEARIAQSIIRSAAPSVCLLHIVVAFRDHFSGRRLRWAVENSEEQSQQPPEKAKVTLDGPGPEVRLDFFGTGFLVGREGENGRILTNHHVVEPWWENPELKKAEQDALEPIMAEMNAYFPGDPRAFRMRTQVISTDADLAVVQGSLAGLRRATLSLDGARLAAVTGDPVVLLGYPTGLDAILARTDEATVRAIVAEAQGNPKAIMAALAARRLIRPLATQGHIGDQLGNRIIYDAQTTSGGSGGPLFNRLGKVIGVNFAMLPGFGGSNFGIPARFAQALLSQQRR